MRLGGERIRRRQDLRRPPERRGDVSHAESLAREAIALLAETDMIEYRGHASRALARVLEAAGRRDEAAAAAREALFFYEQKGLVVPAERARGALARFG